MKFKGTEDYISTRDLTLAVNASITLERPLLVKGEPGTGKTMLAFEVAKALKKEIITWHIKSTTTAQQGLYEYDAVARLRDSQLGEAFESKKQVVLLIDEIDKADIEFPNDLLLELDKMEFYCYELRKTIKAKNRPIVIITSNNEKELPDAFLRRCFFHYIAFPERETLVEIVNVHYPKLEKKLLDQALTLFYSLREVDGFKKKPSTSELIDWLKLLTVGKINADELSTVDFEETMPPYSGALLKNEQDHELLTNLKYRYRR